MVCHGEPPSNTLRAVCRAAEILRIRYSSPSPSPPLSLSLQSIRRINLSPIADGNNRAEQYWDASIYRVSSPRDILSARLPWTPSAPAALVGMLAGSGSAFNMPANPALASGINKSFDNTLSAQLLMMLPWAKNDPHSIYPWMPQLWGYIAGLDKRR